MVVLVRLVGGAALPEVAAAVDGISGAVVLDLAGAAGPLLLPAAGAAGDEDQDSGDEGEDGSGQDAPRGGTPLGGGGGVATPDAPADDREADKVADDGDGVAEEADDGDAGSQQGNKNTLAKGQEESDEEETGSNGMQNHDIGQGLGAFPGSLGAADAAVVRGHGQGVVADVGVAASVISNRRTHTPTERAKVDLALALLDPQDGEVVDDGSRDIGYDEKGGRRQKAEGADITDKGTETHVDCCL
jgi:hypothetical protein